jgi:hypothetical protein
MRGENNMKCEKSFKQDLLKYWGLDELHSGKSYDEVKEGMKRLNRLTLAEVKEVRKEQKGRLQNGI